MKRQNKFRLIIIGVNLIIGNGYIALANLNREPNYELMLGMSVSCCIVYSLLLNLPRFIKLSWWKQFLKLLLINFLTIASGTVITNLLSFPFLESVENVATSLLMGIAGSLLFFWFSFGMGTVSFVLIRLLQKNIL